jgi:hypothetical protein
MIRPNVFCNYALKFMQSPYVLKNDSATDNLKIHIKIHEKRLLTCVLEFAVVIHYLRIICEV